MTEDKYSEHKAMPVIEGVKYAANVWFHQRVFEYVCSYCPFGDEDKEESENSSIFYNFNKLTISLTLLILVWKCK